MRGADLVADVITYNALISACEKGTLPQRAVQLLETMRDQGLLPDGITYNVGALKATRRKGLGAIPGDARPGPGADVFTYSALVSAGAKGQTGRKGLRALPGDA